ncbi:MAG: zinc-dependent alcohol dehydrogenase family protein [Acidobacteriota bacterium]|jgi:alcohol dehydrogenase|nr:zinc-dependent alcohol dehydrogenase family protein [Acidobacteriota bacterium]
MKAAVYEKFKEPLTIQNVPEPMPTKNSVVIKVEACGICRSDWHGWMGNDPDIVLPHVPGHELAGIVEEVGSDIKNWMKGDRVTVPFVGGCGKCPQCFSGNQQVCDFQFQPGFTAWGAFAKYVAIDYADTNLVRLPDEIAFVTASSLGCRFITSFRAVAHQAKVKGGEWVAVHGCGGVGLSAIMIANALGANTIAVDISDEKLEFAKSIGTTAVVNAKTENPIEAIKEITKGGANVSIEALGNPQVTFNSVSSLAKRGRHIQIGLLEAEDKNTAIPINLVIVNELEIIGSHGMQAYKYTEIFEMIRQGKLEPKKLIGKTVSLEESIDELINMNNFTRTGVTVIDRF